MCGARGRSGSVLSIGREAQGADNGGPARGSTEGVFDSAGNDHSIAGVGLVDEDGIFFSEGGFHPGESVIDITDEGG
jgi:hypothetical protein